MGAGEGPQQVLTSNLDQWMIFPESLIDLDGTQCNMIGTGYSAFRYQAVRPDASIQEFCPEGSRSRAHHDIVYLNQLCQRKSAQDLWVLRFMRA